MTNEKLPCCPKCNGVRQVAKTEHKLYYCHRCKMAFDGEEDGDLGYGPPDRRLQRIERQTQRQSQRRR